MELASCLDPSFCPMWLISAAVDHQMLSDGRLYAVLCADTGLWLAGLLSAENRALYEKNFFKKFFEKLFSETNKK